MARIDHTKELSAFEQKRIVAFADYVRILFDRISDECERNGIEPNDCPIYADLAAVVGSVEYFIQEHATNG